MLITDDPTNLSLKNKMVENLHASHCTGSIEEAFYVPFLEHVNQTIAVDKEAKTLIPDHCRLVKFPKGHRLLNTGSICKFVYFIIKGEGISYYTDLDGKTKTWFFHFNRPESHVKNLFAVDYKSFLSETPSTISIEALSPITAIRFSLEDLNTLVQGSRAIEQWLRQLNEQAYFKTYDRITCLLTLTAQQRYEKFLATESYITHMFSQHLVASYLNLAPQSLSRIRKKIAYRV